MRYAVVDCRISDKIAKALGNYADRILRLPPHPMLSAPVASHPDMLIWIYRKNAVMYKDYLEKNRDIDDIFSAAGYEISADSTSVFASYPCDVALNCALVGKNVFANPKTVSGIIKDILQNSSLSLIPTNQGYAKCSTVVVSENAIITADNSIFTAAIANGIDALLVTQGNVALNGYAYGFLGGASGMADNTVFFTGNINAHPDAQRITEFCYSHQKQVVSLSDDMLYDYGTVMLIDSE